MIPKHALNNDESKKERDKIKEIEKNVDRERLIYETNYYTYSFRNFQTIKIFGRDIYQGKITSRNPEYVKELLLLFQVYTKFLIRITKFELQHFEESKFSFKYFF